MEQTKQNIQNKTEKTKEKLKAKKKSQYKKDKEKYFGYYDDIKVGSHKVVDW